MEDIKDFLRSFKEFDAAYCELKKLHKKKLGLQMRWSCEKLGLLMMKYQKKN